MEKIEHTTVRTNGIKMHVASIGSGPAILFLHGFPELWYSWRHQMLALSSLGYCAIAPDLRGYGETDSPPSPESYSALHIVGDLVGLLDHLGLDQVFLVGHDWGAIIAWYFCLFRPDRIKALVNLSVPFFRRDPAINFVEKFRAALGDDFYMCRFQVILYINLQCILQFNPCFIFVLRRILNKIIRFFTLKYCFIYMLNQR